MAKRARLLQPDTVTPTRLGDIPTVSREAIVNALMDGEAMLAMAGGVLEVVVERAETGVPDERVTVAALIRWKDRTDAKPQPERTEPVQAPAAAAPPAPEPEVEAEPVPPDVGVEQLVTVPDDGLDLSTLEEEDLSSIPETLR
jgi:hypothetical protein